MKVVQTFMMPKTSPNFYPLVPSTGENLNLCETCQQLQSGLAEQTFLFLCPGVKSSLKHHEELVPAKL